MFDLCRLPDLLISVVICMQMQWVAGSGCTPEVASVHARPEDHTLTQAKLLDNIMLDSGSGCGCQGHQRHARVPVHTCVFEQTCMFPQV